MRWFRSVGLLSWVVLAAATSALPALASTAAGEEIHGWQEILQYAACALAVAAAASGLGLVAAITGCIFNELFG